MASAPAFAATVKTAVGSVATANTNRDGTGTIATIFSAGSSGSRLDLVWLKSTNDPADCTIVLYLHDGTTHWCLTEADFGNPAAGSATVATYETQVNLNGLNIPTGWSLRASITAAPTAGVVNVFVFGADY